MAYSMPDAERVFGSVAREVLEEMNPPGIFLIGGPLNGFYHGPMFTGRWLVGPFEGRYEIDYAAGYPLVARWAEQCG